MIQILNLYSGLKSISLEHRLIQIFATYTASFFLNELMLLGFEYFFNYPESLNLELTKGTFYLKSLLYNNPNKSYLFRNYILYNNNNIEFKSFNNFNFIFFKLYTKLNPISNSLYLMTTVGARASEVQASQITNLRGYITNVRNFITPIPILENFISGLSMLEFLLSSYGTRKGILDTAVKTSTTGYLTRRIIESIQDIVIKEFYCGTNNLLKFNIFNTFSGNIQLPEFSLLENKYLVKFKNFNNFEKSFSNVYLNYKTLINLINKNLNFELFLNTPITCISGRSVCNKCLGLNYQIKIIPSDNLGIIVGESLGELGTQLTLRTFHTGGTLLDKEFNSFYNNSFLYKNQKLFSNINILFINNKIVSYNKLFKFKIYNTINNINFKNLFISKTIKLNLKIKFPININIIPKYLKNQKILNYIIYNKNIINRINGFYSNKISNLIFKNKVFMLIKNLNNDWLLYNIKECIGYINTNKISVLLGGIIIKHSTVNINNILDILSISLI